MYISSKVGKQRGPRITTTYNITSYEFREPTYTTLFLFDTGDISYSGGVVAFSITRQQAASILAHIRDRADVMKVQRKHITDDGVTTVYTREATVSHPKNYAFPTLV